MKKGRIIDYETVAALLANESDEEQGAFFKVFIKELKSQCKTTHNTQMQLAHINDKLNDEEKELISMLGYKED
jgi:hypothetical protein